MAHILVVDDDVHIRETLALALTVTGHEVQTARDGHEAVAALLFASHPLVVLLDAMMPRMNGEAVVRLVAEKASSLAQYAFILITANADLLSKGFHELLRQLDIPLLSKPFHLDALLAAVETAAARLSGQTTEAT
jgi:CheY-like chemotaxis protein